MINALGAAPKTPNQSSNQSPGTATVASPPTPGNIPQANKKAGQVKINPNIKKFGKKKKMNPKLIMGILLLVLLLVGGGVGLYLTKISQDTRQQAAVGDTCNYDIDCDQAAGETCNSNTNQCIVDNNSCASLSEAQCGSCCPGWTYSGCTVYNNGANCGPECHIICADGSQSQPCSPGEPGCLHCDICNNWEKCPDITPTPPPLGQNTPTPPTTQNTPTPTSPTNRYPTCSDLIMSASTSGGQVDSYEFNVIASDPDNDSLTYYLYYALSSETDMCRTGTWTEFANNKGIDEISTWDISQVPAGEYIIIARVFDSTGNICTGNPHATAATSYCGNEDVTDCHECAVSLSLNVDNSPTPTPTGLVNSPTPTGSVVNSPTPTNTPPPGVTWTPAPTVTLGTYTPTPGSYTAYTPAPTTIGCNSSCTENASCTSVNANWICYENRCRLDVNPESPYCDYPQELPETGPKEWLQFLKVGLGMLGTAALLLLLL